MMATSDVTVPSDRSHDSSGTSGHEFVSQAVSRRGEMLASELRDPHHGVDHARDHSRPSLVDGHRHPDPHQPPAVTRLLLRIDCYSASIKPWQPTPGQSAIRVHPR